VGPAVVEWHVPLQANQFGLHVKPHVLFEHDGCAFACVVVHGWQFALQ
jgi:hypothetical protein